MADRSETKAGLEDDELKNVEVEVAKAHTIRKSSAAIENGHNGAQSLAELTIVSSDGDGLDSTDEPPAKRSWRQRYARVYSTTISVIVNAIFIGYFVWATYHYVFLSKNYAEIKWPPVNGTVAQNLEEDAADQSAGQCPAVDPCAPPTRVVYPYCPTFCGIQWCDGYGMLVILYALIYTALFYYKVVKRVWGARLHKAVLQPIVRFGRSVFGHRWRKQLAAGLVLAGILAYVIVDSLDSPSRLQSLTGIFAIFGIGYAFSAHRSRIDFQPVFSGFVLQFLLGIFCIRWEVGRSIFRCIGDKVATFLNYTDVGSAFVYGQQLVDKRIFVFTVLPIIFFFSFIISILYYLGAMQFVVMKLGWILQTVLGTTVCESVTCSANIFLGMSESPLLIRPYIKHLTTSEIHVIMASGFATVSGSVLAAFIAYGAEPSDLITSSVMAAPAALGFAKLFYPETEESKTKSSNMVLEKTTDSSILDAASNGATLAINIVLGVTANLIAFVSFVAFLNGVVSYLGFLVGYDGVTFESIFSKLFIPLAWLIGIPWEDCDKVAYVIASKSIINEFVAYERLGVLKRAKLISLRSSAIATYSICGFANPSSLGIMIATMSTMAPGKRRVITSVALRGFVAGTLICFLTASIAGLLMTNEIFEENANRQF